MNKMYSRQYFLMILLCTLFQGRCKTEPKGPAVQHVQGIWEVISAERNNRPTGTLAGTYFIFTENGTMKSNLPLTGEQGEWITNFEISADTLIQKSIPSEQYLIKSWSDTSLVLEFSVRGIPFKLALARTTSEKIYPAANDTIISNE